MAIDDQQDDKDLIFLPGYKPDHLYVNRGTANGVYVTLLDEGEELVDEIEVSARTRVALSLFYNDSFRDFKTLRLTKIQFSRGKWHKEGWIVLHQTSRSKLREFLSLLLTLDFHGAQKTRIAVDHLDVSALSSILRTDKGADLLKNLANSPELTADIFALAYKKQALETFGNLLGGDVAVAAYKREHNVQKSGREAAWQHFFEANPWIFGHGLSYVFLHGVAKKLEATTTGATFINAGDRIDALMKTKAAVSQFVLIEIKTPELELLASKPYRTGCWAIHPDLTDAVSQVQKTAYDFTVNQTTKVQLRNQGGWATGDEVYRVQPKTFLVAGRLEQMRGHDDRATCFELFRRSLTSPEIITFDELYERAKCIVATISAEPQSAVIPDDEDDVPF